MTVDSPNLPASTLPRRNPSAVASWVLLIVWLAGSAAAFWFMEMRDWRSFERSDAAFDAADAAQIERWYRSTTAFTLPAHAPFKLTFVHLYAPDCRCNRFVEPHLQRLIEHYQPLGVHFLAAPAHAPSAKAATPFDLPAILENHDALAAAGVDSSPAALIFDANGRLIYYGPYSDSAWCGSTGTLVEPALDRALFGLATVQRPRASRGCFCGW
jgi:hypothetical protein